MEEILPVPCRCFGDRLRYARNLVVVPLDEFAARVGSPTQVVDEVERGLRAVSTTWVAKADEVLRTGGDLLLTAGDCLHYHAWGHRDTLNGAYRHEGAGPIRLPAAYILSAA
jgi:hypothetical protein